MTPSPTPADIEDILIGILRKNRPGTRVRGCHGHMGVYDREVQKRILEPLLRARFEAGQIAELDDLGHDTPFTAAWNRTIHGNAHDWDCRTLAAPLVRAAVRDVPDFFEKVFEERFDEIDDALIRNLPDILAGPGLTRPATCEGLRSWVDDEHVWVRLDGQSPVLCEKDGSALREPPRYRAFLERETGQEETAYLGLMSFHATGIDHEEGQRAWSAWRIGADKAGLMGRDAYRSMIRMMVANAGSMNELDICWSTLRQDERISIETRPDGFIVWRGAVAGLPTLVDEGQFICGPRSALTALLTVGGFSPDQAESYLDRLVEGGSAFAATVPAGATERVLIDPETLLGFDLPDDEMAECETFGEARALFAAGTFEMPEMLSLRERSAHKRPETETCFVPQEM